jgi:hypothetical protein
VYRPRVASEPRSDAAALIVDCTLDASFWVDVSGAPTNDTSRTPGPFGVFAAMVRGSGRWIVGADGPEEFSCAP